MSDAIHFDHVALASNNAWDQIIRYGYHMGAKWLGGPDDYSRGIEDRFYFAQMELEAGTKLEFIQPLRGEGSDFLHRFLDRNGPGPHHFTFEVPDLDESTEAATSAGYRVVGVSKEDVSWQEAFLHPKLSHGIVIQFAHQGDDPEASEEAVVRALPPSRRRRPPRLDKVVHLVADLERAAKLFSGPLAMKVAASGTSDLGEFVQLTDGPWTIELIRPDAGPAAHWMGTRSGRLLQLCFSLDDPGSIPDAHLLGDGTYVVPPEHNLGTRLVLAQRA